MDEYNNQYHWFLYTLYVYLLLNRRRRTKRRIWIRNIFHETQRREAGAQRLINEMCLMEPNKYFNYLRVTPEQFNSLLGFVGPHITKLETLFRSPIPPATRFALTLRPLSSCATQVPPILTPPSLEFSQSTTSSQSLSSSLNSPESYNFSKSSKRPRRSTTIEDELLHGLSALKPPVPAASDSVDHFCRSIADSLRMLDMKNRLSAEIEIMQLLHKFYN